MAKEPKGLPALRQTLHSYEGTYQIRDLILGKTVTVPDVFR